MGDKDTKAIWATIGCIKEMSLMAKTVIIFGKGCFLEFLHLTTGETHHHTINNNKINGDGIKCFVGHVSLYIFAYCEMCQNPNIYLKTYPDFQIIAKFSGEKVGYKCLTFSDGSVFFALGAMPNYTVTAWNWRTKEKFAESPNELLFEDQIIRCSYGRPMYLAQFGVGSNKLFICDVFIVCKSIIFTKHEVQIGKLKPAAFQNIVWSMDSPTVYIIDIKGCIYTVDRDFYLELVVGVSETDISGSITPSICWYNHGLMVSGPNQEIRHYKKVAAEWICDKSYRTTVPIYSILSEKNENCLGRTELSEIVSFGFTPESFTFVRQNQSNFMDLCPINPTREFMVVALSGYNMLNVYRIKTKEILSSMVLKHKISSIRENPLYPFMVVGHKNGILSLISCYNETQLTVLLELHIAEFELHTTRFYEQGHIFVTGNKHMGEFFILKGLPGTKIEVMVHLKIGRQTTDYMLVASQNIIRFFVIPVTQNLIYAGNKILRYCIVDNQVVDIKEFEFEDKKSLYTDLLPKKGPDRDRTFFLIPYCTRYIEAAETKRGCPVIKITQHIKTGHQMKSFKVKRDVRNIITWGFDGFIFLHCPNFEKMEGMTIAQHRYEHGVKKAIINASATIIVSLGENNDLVAMQLIGKPEDEEYVKQVQEQMASPKMALMFKRPTLGFTLEDRFAGKCWVEAQRLITIEAEEIECKNDKNNLLKEFQDIREILTNLVTENLMGPENKKLDLLEFYLDTKTYHLKDQQSKDDCKELETYLKNLIIAQDKVSTFIVDKYYTPMGVQWDNILGIYSAVKATNYCLLPVNIPREKRNRWIEEQRKVEIYLNYFDSFEPWQTLSPEEIADLMNKRPVLPKDDYTGIMALIAKQTVNDAADLIKYQDNKVALQGSVSQLYIDISPGHYTQRQLTTFYQNELQQAIAEMEVIKLKQCYNKSFQNTKALKEREMYNIKEKNDRFRQIISEFNYFSEHKINIDISDPEWETIENVEADILHVHEYEIPVQPYISPSEQVILDKKAEEEERIRLLLLSDDFRERALMAMMNGVLEVRWEDELKKDVPKPKCMLEKSPEEYNEEDLRSIRDYDEKVVQLKIEREKYKSLLENEFGKLSHSLRDSIRKFNLKLYESTKFKFYIDQGMNQENLLVNRQRVIQNKRIEIDEKESDIINQIRMRTAQRMRVQ